MSRKIPTAIPLTNSVMNHLSEIHGSYKEAYAHATRDMKPEKPASEARGKLETRTLVVNDLHIGPGYDPVMKKYDPSDDFTATQDRQFVALLVNEWMAAGMGNENLSHPTKVKVGKVLSQLKWADGKPINLEKLGAVVGSGAYALKLSINGDFVDFLQTTKSRPHLPFPDGVNKDGAPLNTPANSIVILNTIREGHPEVFRALAVHLALGHAVDIIPGNHDRHLYNAHVWSGEVEVPGKKLGGFTKLIEEELRSLGLDESEVKASLGRLERKPFAIYGDKWVDHGDMADNFNRVRRPLGELLDPSGLHDEMQMALGDYGVRNGFNKFEPLDPSLDAIDDRGMFWNHARKHPIKMFGLVKGFLRAAKADGYEQSAEADMAQRLADVRRLVDEHPFVMEQLNSFRPEGEKLTKAQVQEGLEEIEKVSAKPFFSNFRRGSLFVVRALQIAFNNLAGKNDARDKSEVNLDRGLAAQVHFGVNGIVEGHTHVAKYDSYVTSEEKGFVRMNTHTWMSKEGSWGRPEVTWGQDGRGVGVIETGVDKEGKPWVDMRLEKVVGEDGGLVRGDLYSDAEVGELSSKGLRERVKELFAEVHDEAEHLLERFSGHEDEQAPAKK
ncbi:MAG: hypothetical protein HYV07_29630 [Deltaproteobacteria bacterium]|nr:hypothetical protein [Deltaproteobacteria bacterium]